MNKYNISTGHIGEKVHVDGVELNIYTEGVGSKTLVFMAGFGSCSPRDLKTMVNQQRKAMSLCNILPPYTLCPLSLSGLEAIYWASNYPDEIEAIVGLDMSFSETMREFKYSLPLIKFMGLLMRSKAARMFNKLVENEVYTHGNLSTEEKNLYKELFFEKTMSKDMINEAVYLDENIRIAESLTLPKIPMLLFISNGEETGIEKTLYLQIYSEITKKIATATVVNLSAIILYMSLKVKKLQNGYKAIYIEQNI